MTISGDIPEHKEWCSLLTFSFQLTTQKDSIRGVILKSISNYFSIERGWHRLKKVEVITLLSNEAGTGTIFIRGPSAIVLMIRSNSRIVVAVLYYHCLVLDYLIEVR